MILKRTRLHVYIYVLRQFTRITEYLRSLIPLPCYVALLYFRVFVYAVLVIRLSRYSYYSRRRKSIETFGGAEHNRKLGRFN